MGTIESQRHILRTSFKVCAGETDLFGQVYVKTLCRFFLEALNQHSIQLRIPGSFWVSQGLTWVIAGMKIKVRQLPTIGDYIHIDTWLQDIQSFNLFRRYIVRDNDQNIVTKATTWMILIDIKARKTLRIPTFLQAYLVNDQEEAEVEGFTFNRRLFRFQTVTEEKKFQVRLSDIDFNQHASHLSYVGWTMDMVPYKICQKFILKELDLFFLKEARYKDVVIGQAECTYDCNIPMIINKFLDQKDNRELFLSRSIWRQN